MNTLLHHARRARLLAALAAVPAIAGCAGYTDFRTLVANNFQRVTIEVAPEVSATAQLQNVVFKERPMGARGFVLQGEVSHARACRVLTLGVSFVSVKGVILRNTDVGITDYPGSGFARFDTVILIDAKIGADEDVIGKVRFTGARCL